MPGNTEILHIHSEQVEVRRRRRQRNMNLSVRSDGRLRVSCNLRRSVGEISAFVESCRDFISRRREQIAESERLYPRLRYVSGEQVLWFGESVSLDVIWGWREKVRAARYVGGGVEIVAPISSSVEDRRMALSKLYKKEARPWFETRLRFFAGLMGVVPQSLSVRGQRTLWGSCSGEGDISLNWKLLVCPPAVIDYVVVHELAHIRHRNHSEKFWSFVAQFDPQYKEHRRFLKTVEPIVARIF